MKNDYAFDYVCFEESVDDFAFLEVAGITARRRYYADRSVRAPIYRTRSDLPVNNRVEDLDQIAIEPRHHYLRLRVGKPRVVFDHLRPAICEHQPCVEHTAEWIAFSEHACERRLD